MNLNLIAGHELAEGAGLDHGGQRFLGGRDKLVREVCTTRNAGAQLEFCIRSQTSRIKVVLIEGVPDASGKLARGGRACCACGRRMLMGRASSNSLEEITRLARRQSSSDSGEPNRRSRAPLVSKSVRARAPDWSEGGTVLQELRIRAHPAQDRSIVKAP